MSYIPDCRTNENYNYDRLNEADKAYIDGYDCCVEMGIDSFFDNLDTYIQELDIEGEDINLCRFLDNHEEVRETFKECLKEWIESNRDGLIVGIIDGYPFDEE